MYRDTDELEPTPRRYVVTADHATVRSQARQDGEILRRLDKGHEWIGVPIAGGAFNAPGYAKTATWVRAASGAVVWLGHLSEETL